MLSILKKSQKGFTLIEMLVVIAIISILIGIGVNTFTIAQKKARDTKRKADISTIKKALIAYSLDHAGSFCSGILVTCALGDLDTSLKPTYLPTIPQDPTNSTTPYVFSGTSTSFKLQATLENSGDPDKAPVAAAGAAGNNCPGAVTATTYYYCQTYDQ